MDHALLVKSLTHAVQDHWVATDMHGRVSSRTRLPGAAPSEDVTAGELLMPLMRTNWEQALLTLVRKPANTHHSYRKLPCSSLSCNGWRDLVTQTSGQQQYLERRQHLVAGSKKTVRYRQDCNTHGRSFKQGPVCMPKEG